jgi:chemotaxis receptor (MCP) glutamine deamidase CheD
VLRGFLDLTTRLAVDQLDVSRGEVHVKVFSGAEVLGIAAAAKPAIGKPNSEAAIGVSEAEGCKIIASSLGGNLGRQLQFHTGTGEGGAALAREVIGRASITARFLPIE